MDEKNRPDSEGVEEAVSVETEEQPGMDAFVESAETVVYPNPKTQSFQPDDKKSDESDKSDDRKTGRIDPAASLAQDSVSDANSDSFSLVDNTHEAWKELGGSAGKSADFLEESENEKSEAAAGSEPVIIPENLQAELDSLDAQIQEMMKKYKLTIYLLIGSIVFYLIFLFVIRESWSTWVVLGICVVMIVLAVINSRDSRRIQKLATRRAELKKALEKPVPGRSEAPSKGDQDLQTPVVANATSLNDLPKQYTVLDEIEFSDGQKAEHIIVSPYGIALVGDIALRDDIASIAQEVADDIPIFVYSPQEEADDVAQLVEDIQMEKTVVLQERQVMDLLFKLTGLGN